MPAAAMRASTLRRTSLRSGVRSNTVISSATSFVAQVEDRSLPEAARVVGGVAGAECLVEHLEHRLARAGQRTRLDERLERALVHELRVDAVGEVPDVRERPTVGARGDDRAARVLADVLHGVEPEADLPLDDSEVDRRLVHV